MFFLENFILFTIYSFLGWIAETIYCFILDGKYTNRGFLNGPICPIYGFGAILVINLLGKYSNNLIVLFSMSILIAAIIEYITSYGLEKIFNLSLWDYSKHKFNLNGRISLWNLLLFGLLAVAMIHIIHPAVISILIKIPNWIYYIALGILIPSYLIDLIVTVVALNQVKSMIYKHMLSLDQIIKARDEVIQGFKDEIDSIAENSKIKILHIHRRLLKAYPNMKLLNYPDAVAEFKEYFEKSINIKKYKKKRKGNNQNE